MVVAKNYGLQKVCLRFEVFDKWFGICYAAYQDYLMGFEVGRYVFVVCKIGVFVANVRKEDFLIWKGVYAADKVFLLLQIYMRTLGYHNIVGSLAALGVFSQKSERHDLVRKKWSRVFTQQYVDVS